MLLLDVENYTKFNPSPTAMTSKGSVLGRGRYGQNAGMGSAGRGGFRRRNGGIGAAEKSASAAEKSAGKEKRREWGRGLLGSVGTDRDNRVD